MKRSELISLIQEAYQEVIKEASTPWGKSDSEYKIEPGVIWYGTPSHGGLYVSYAVADKNLTPQAKELGMEEKGGYWYEEDAQWVIPMYENYEWYKKLLKLIGNDNEPTLTKEKIEKDIKTWNPEYFDPKFIDDANKKHGNKKDFPIIQERDKIDTKGLKVGWVAVTEIIEPKKRFIVTGSDYNRYRMNIGAIKRYAIEVFRGGKSIWKKD